MKKTLLILLSIVSLQTLGQKTDTPDAVYDLGGKIEFIRLTDAGVLVVAGAGGLAGIKPDSKTPHFNFKEYGKVKEEELIFVPFSPYLIVSQGGLMSSKKTVIDIISGKTLFATEENGWKTISELEIFLPQNKLVVVGNRGNKEQGLLAAAIYDLGTGSQEVFASLDPNVGKVRTGNSIPLSSGKPFLTANSLLVPTTKKLLSIDLKTGKQLWESDVNKITWMSADSEGNNIYTFEERTNGDTRIQKVSNKGESLWKDERKIKGKVSRFEILPEGIAIVSDVDNSGKSGVAKMASGASESKIAFLNAASGEDLWDKAPKTKGYVQHFYIMSDGILFGIESGGINKISYDGRTLFKKPLSTGENIHTMASTPQGLIYITDTDAGIVDLVTGESIWNKPIKYSKAKAVSSAYDVKNKRYLISTGNEIIAIDEKSGDVSTLTKVSFEEKEVPTSLTVRNEGLLLSSSQNLMMLDFDGKKKFHSYYKSPGQSTFVKIATGTLAVASMAMASAAAYQGGRYGHYSGSNQLNSFGEQMKIQQEGFANIASASFQEMNKRFRATASTENAQFILTSLDSGIGLVKVNKATGNMDKEVLLKDKKPDYQVDEQGGVLYYKSKDNQISAFKL
jgi:hypothetical protein